jgi:hypothetical protein
LTWRPVEKCHSGEPHKHSFHQGQFSTRVGGLPRLADDYQGQVLVFGCGRRVRRES